MFKAACRNYDKRISIESLTGTTTDGHGHVDNTVAANWTEYEPAYGAVQTKGGREFWKVDKVDATVSHVWWCPYSTLLAATTPDMRLIHDSKTYEIISVQDIDEAHIEIEIQTRRAV